MCSSFPGLLIGRTAVHSGKDPAFVAYDQFLSTGICNRSAGARSVVGHSRRYCHVRSHVRYHQQRTLCDISLDHLIGARSGCCVRAASGHAAAAPPSAASNSRRAMVTLIRPSRARCVRERYHATSVLSLTARTRACAPADRRSPRGSSSVQGGQFPALMYPSARASSSEQNSFATFFVLMLS